MKTYLVTGGAGFIGTNFIRHALTLNSDWRIINLDVLTYAGNPANFEDLPPDVAKRYVFIPGDIQDKHLLDGVFSKEDLDGVIHFAAESHVDRSILGPEAFVQTNVVGTFTLLQRCLEHWKSSNNKEDFRFLHVSTDEVYGSLGSDGYFTENTPYDPSSPYSASKASADHFVKAYHRTFGLPAVITNCSNNYGPYQFPEKLIPLIISNILAHKPLPIYGDGKNVRDWLYVIDHCEALLAVLNKGKPGETYNIGGGAERENIQIVHTLCDILDNRLGSTDNGTSRELITYISDRPGHDRRYAIDAGKIKQELGWSPRYRFEEALEDTVDWYLQNTSWVDSVQSGEYLKWIEKNYHDRQS